MVKLLMFFIISDLDVGLKKKELLLEQIKLTGL